MRGKQLYYARGPQSVHVSFSFLDLPLRLTRDSTPAAKNETSVLCNEPVRDMSGITPMVVSVSMSLAIFTVILRAMDCCYRRNELTHWSNLAVVGSLVGSQERAFEGMYILTGVPPRLRDASWAALNTQVSRPDHREYDQTTDMLLTRTVSAMGFGRDIWTIPFDDVTEIIKVSSPSKLAATERTALSQHSSPGSPRSCT